MQNSRLAFVAFTASWCPYSQELLGSFTQAAAKYKEKYPDRKTVWGNVDCVSEMKLGDDYNIVKYPTMKVFFYGHPMVEHRGSRQVNGLIEFVEKMENTAHFVDLNEAESLTQWQQFVRPKKPTLIVWFPQGSPPYEMILKAIAVIYERTIVVAPVASNSLEHEEHKLWFSLDGEHVEHYNGSVTNFKEILEWIKQKVVDMVRELTFEIMEEVAEQEKPMLVLFRKKGDLETERKFIEAIDRDLEKSVRRILNIFLADGELLRNVVIRFNRNPDDLPFLVVDQLVHAYPAAWTGDEIFAPGNIKQFVSDLFNENHHKKLHEKVNELLQKILTETERLEREAEEEKDDSKETPSTLDKQESVFKQLKPSKTRYSFAKEEL
ncbi:unnamed protein product [Caenorhabditis nigoni]